MSLGNFTIPSTTQMSSEIRIRTVDSERERISEDIRTAQEYKRGRIRIILLNGECSLAQRPPSFSSFVPANVSRGRYLERNRSMPRGMWPAWL